MSLLFFGFTVSLSARADTHDVQYWHALQVTGRLQPPAKPGETAPQSPALFTFDVQPRLSLLDGGPHFIVLRGAVGWQFDLGPLAPALSVWAGAAAIPKYEDLAWNVNETRLWQQALLTDTLGPFSLAIRGRLEERSFEGAPELSWRTRAMLRAMYRIGEGPWRAVASGEGFVGVFGPSARLGFDQSRTFVGVNHAFGPWFSVEGGYMWIYIDSTEPRHLHTLFLMTLIQL